MCTNFEALSTYIGGSMSKNVQTLAKTSTSIFSILGGKLETVYWPGAWLVGFLNATKMTQ